MGRMQVELNSKEIDLLGQALEAWEKQVGSDALMQTLLGGLLAPKDHNREVYMQERTELIRKAEMETSARRTKSILLRAKLIQAAAHESEHVID